MTRFVIVAVALMLLPGAARAQTPTAAADAATAALIQKSCAACHPVGQVMTAHKSKEDWGATLDKMIGFGAQISDKDYDVMVDYLARTHGPAAK
ncbi:hypothetical protein Q4F19_14375 [Sphingomonas sp. BIUV-7]|uniref:Uncharacterized protein n=1 Tax=Sphingomonas natans TaxID=3063330 RepID=A0ABT8YC63_9SPHN|nr:hypothetical protein [Sphingomonas sp. BIUV-7]MDO6415572.1 hypothetical protein [Sphingomonas sp. BIUV-7]